MNTATPILPSVRGMQLLHPKELTVKTQMHGDITVTMHKFDCISGREIYAKYPTSNLPKLGEYGVSEAVMLTLMQFVTVPVKHENTVVNVQLKTMAQVMQHIPDWEALNEIERGMLAYNFSFFENGKGWTSLTDLVAKFGKWASKISTASLGQFFQVVEQHLKNSAQSTPSKTDS